MGIQSEGIQKQRLDEAKTVLLSRVKSVFKSVGSAEVKKTVEDRLCVLREEAIRAKLEKEAEAREAAAPPAPRGILGLGGRFL